MKKEKKKIIKEFARHEADKGSSEVQIGLLTKEIKELTKHLKTHYHDFSARKSLLRKVAQRKKLLRYLAQADSRSYEKIIKKIARK